MEACDSTGGVAVCETVVGFDEVQLRQVSNIRRDKLVPADEKVNSIVE
jgi:hypothetical protein